MFISYINVFFSLPSSLSKSNDKMSLGEDFKKIKKECRIDQVVHIASGKIYKVQQWVKLPDQFELNLFKLPGQIQ